MWPTEKNQQGDLGEVECPDREQGSNSLIQLNICEKGEFQQKLMIDYAYIDIGRLWEGWLWI